MEDVWYSTSKKSFSLERDWRVDASIQHETKFYFRASDNSFQYFRALNSSPTINFQARAGDEARLVAGEEETVIGDVEWVGEAAEGDVAEEFFEILLCGRHADEGLEAEICQTCECKRVWLGDWKVLIWS